MKNNRSRGFQPCNASCRFFSCSCLVVLRMLVLCSGCLGDAIHLCGEELLFGPRPWRCTVVRIDDSNKVSREKLKKTQWCKVFANSWITYTWIHSHWYTEPYFEFEMGTARVEQQLFAVKTGWSPQQTDNTLFPEILHVLQNWINQGNLLFMVRGWEGVL